MLKDIAKELAEDSCDPQDVQMECGYEPGGYDKCMASCEEELRKRAARK
ncbi:hypothetical protein [Archangium minus]